jgi:hypothetical protein
MPGGVREVRHSAGVRNPSPQLLGGYKLGAGGDAHLRIGRFWHVRNGCREPPTLASRRLVVKWRVLMLPAIRPARGEMAFLCLCLFGCTSM